MKYRKRLITKIKELQGLYNINVLYPKTKHKDLQKYINQVYKLTKFLDNRHITLTRLSVRIEYVYNNLKCVSKCKHCGIRDITTHKSIFCGNKCQKKYFDLNETDENMLIRVTKAAQSRDYKNIHIKGTRTKIQNGLVKHPNIRYLYNIYFTSSKFKHGFKTNCEKQKALLKEHGIYNTKDNTKGCVRDHLLSRRYGFDNNIATWIISHPANCEIVLHSENIRRSSTNDNIITLEELLERIENWVE